MASAHIGPLTSVMQGLATAIGAGMVIGGFLAGSTGAVGGMGALVLVMVDLVLRYGG